MGPGKLHYIIVNGFPGGEKRAFSLIKEEGKKEKKFENAPWPVKIRASGQVGGKKKKIIVVLES